MPLIGSRSQLHQDKLLALGNFAFHTSYAIPALKTFTRTRTASIVSTFKTAQAFKPFTSGTTNDLWEMRHDHQRNMLVSPQKMPGTPRYLVAHDSTLLARIAMADQNLNEIQNSTPSFPISYLEELPALLRSQDQAPLLNPQKPEKLPAVRISFSQVPVSYFNPQAEERTKSL
jgi:hypothetical protein